MAYPKMGSAMPKLVKMIDPDVVRDLFSAGSVNEVYDAQSRKYGITRELYPFLSKIYFYDTDGGSVTFIKDNVPERP